MPNCQTQTQNIVNSVQVFIKVVIKEFRYMYMKHTKTYLTFETHKNILTYLIPRYSRYCSILFSVLVMECVGSLYEQWQGHNTTRINQYPRLCWIWNKINWPLRILTEHWTRLKILADHIWTDCSIVLSRCFWLSIVVDSSHFIFEN